MKNNIHKVYNQKEFLVLMKKKIKDNDIIILDERGNDIHDSKSLWALEIAKLTNNSFLIDKKKRGEKL